MHTSSSLAFKQLSDWPSDTNNVGLLIEQALLSVDWGRRLLVVSPLIEKIYLSPNPPFNNLPLLVALGNVRDKNGLVALLRGVDLNSGGGYEKFSQYQILETGLLETVTHIEALCIFDTPPTDYATGSEVLGLILSNRKDLLVLLKEGYRLFALGKDIITPLGGYGVCFYLENETLCMERVYAHRATPWSPFDLAVVRYF